MKAKQSMWRVFRSVMMGLSACLLVVGVLGCAPKSEPAPSGGETMAPTEEAPAEEAPAEEAAPAPGN